MVVRTWSNPSMSDDIEGRLAAAAQAMHEYDSCTRHRSELSARETQMAADLASAQAQYSSEERDVERLEGMSFSRVFASLRGSRDDALARERAEADAARYRTSDAESRLAAVRGELASVDGRLSQLATAPAEYADALNEKETFLVHSTDPRGHRLMELADERGRLSAAVGEMQAALQAAQAADQALAQVQDRLGSASNWSTYDIVFGGGMIGNAVKHQRMDEAAQAAAEADRRLATLRTDLTHMSAVDPTAPGLQVSSGLRFVDIFFNNIFTDLAVAHQIGQAQANVSQAVQFVAEVRDRLNDQIAHAQAQLASADAERHQVLTS